MQSHVISYHTLMKTQTMQKFKKAAVVAFASAASLFMVSCDAGSSDEEGSTDPAPDTLDATSLMIFNDTTFRFDFGKISGDATTGTESGFCSSFEPSETTTLSLIDAVGAPTIYEFSTRISNVSYTYQKTGSHSGTIVITADGAPNPDAETLVEDIFVGSSYTINLDIIFGSESNYVEEIFVDGNTNGTEDFSTVTFSTNTVTYGASFVMQDDSAVPVGYGSEEAETATKTVAEYLYPDTPFASQLFMVFDTALTTDPAELLQIAGVSSDDQGYEDVIDQGKVNVDTNSIDVSGDVTFVSTESSVTYAWEAVENDNTSADLILERTSGTEVYRFNFSSFEDGTFTRTQPLDGATGSFSFPDLDNGI